ncbi:hypothetical protein V8E52_006566 [Russula decolorans]
MSALLRSIPLTSVIVIVIRSCMLNSLWTVARRGYRRVSDQRSNFQPSFPFTSRPCFQVGTVWPGSALAWKNQSPTQTQILAVIFYRHSNSGGSDFGSPHVKGFGMEDGWPDTM